MIFTSVQFLYVFLPLVLLGFGLARRVGGLRAGMVVLIGSSLVFYGSWNPWNLLLLLGSLTANHTLSALMDRTGQRRRWFVAGLLLNLSVLFYFKYAAFAVEAGRDAGFWHWSLPKLVLPLGISFITFQKIAFLLDRYRGTADHPRFRDFVLFVTFFPQLIAGPIVHHAEFIPQIGRIRFDVSMVALGAFVFFTGAAKKVLLADPLAAGVDMAFAEVDAMGMLSAWYFLLAYTFQLYFDFSGYSDMAVGLGLMFGLQLPWNFLSPLKAASIIDFWRRWHATLSRFLRDSIYVPLGGSRQGALKTCRNLGITMLAGGIWHGAGWQFVVWGGLHGMALIAAHLWRGWGWAMPRPAGWGLTFGCVMIGWVFFRSENLAQSGAYLSTMSGLSQMSWLTHWGQMADTLPFLLAAAFICFAMPNTRELASRIRWSAAQLLWLGILVTAVCARLLGTLEPPKFLYFDF